MRFMVLPDILKNAPFFKKIETKQQRQASSKSGSKAKQAAQQRASGACTELTLMRMANCGCQLHRLPTSSFPMTGRRDVGLPEKQKMREARQAGKMPNFS